MAGIGFQFRRLNPHGSFAGLLRVYGAAGIISSGPWCLSIFGILLIGFLCSEAVERQNDVAIFQVSVTYLFSMSLVYTGALQLVFTRFVADRFFEKRSDIIRANLIGAITVNSVLAGITAAIAIPLIMPNESIHYQMLLVAGFVLMCDVWIVVVLLTGLKAYRTILFIFFVAYAITVGAALALRDFGLEGLLAGFIIGHAALLFLLFALLLRAYQGNELVRYDFLRRSQIYPSLGVIGFLYNLGIWIDKFLFWFNPLTNHGSIGPVPSSAVYDVPIFLAYLTVVPGMAVFLVRMETDFAELHASFYDLVRDGGTLQAIERTRNNMVYTVRQGIYEIFKVQGLTLLVVFLAGPAILRLVGISPFYLNLFYIDATAVGAQVILLAILNVLFYLDLRKISLFLVLYFAVMNAFLTAVTQVLGPATYGYGFAIAVCTTSLIGISILSKRLDRLVRETFMLQSVQSS